MQHDKINKIRKKVSGSSPLIHCITNPISINQCANTILSSGARPIMAEHPREAAEITETASALCLNLGNITDVRMESMMISLLTAKEHNIPVILDLVGIACSSLRREFAVRLIEAYTPQILKGNYSEIAALQSSAYRSAGVDADKTLDVLNTDNTVSALSGRLGTTVLASGKTDIICSDGRLIHVNNGTPQLSRITGTGCMLGALAACYLGVCQGADAAMTACAVMGISGELAETDKGNGTFMVKLMDKLSALTDSEIKKHLKTEVIFNETL